MKNKCTVWLGVILSLGFGSAAVFAGELQCNVYNRGSSSEFGVAQNAGLGQISFRSPDLNFEKLTAGNAFRLSAKGTANLDFMIPLLNESRTKKYGVVAAGGDLVYSDDFFTITFHETYTSKRGKVYRGHQVGILVYNDGSAIFRVTLMCTRR